MSNEGYTTPEGFWLSKRLLLPDARAFSDVLHYVREWNHDAMTPRSGVVPQPNLVPAPRYLTAEGKFAKALRDLADWAELPPPPPGARNEVGPFCTVDLSQIGGKAHRSMAVVATDAVMEALAPRVVTPDDHISFEVIAHRERRRALVIAQHSYINGNHWLAYIDPDTIPPYPFELRDQRAKEIRTAMEEAGDRPVRYPNDEPYAIDYRNGRPGCSLRAVIHPDGSVTRTWADGTVTIEPPRES